MKISSNTISSFFSLSGLHSQLKRDYLNYLLSAIVPVIITAGSVPLFKHLLGAATYGIYSVSVNVLMLIAAASTGWICQSILRFYPPSAFKSQFRIHTWKIGIYSFALLSLPIFIGAWYFRKDMPFAVFFLCAAVIVAFNFIAQSLSQAAFLSGRNISSELVRTVSFITTALILLLAFPQFAIYSLFIALAFSYLLSARYLNQQTINTLHLLPPGDSGAASSLQLKQLATTFFKYGFPLSLWFVFAYLLTITDKLFILKHVGAETQGNYQAMFDLLNRGITIVIAPMAISLMPFLSAKVSDSDVAMFRATLNRILVIELVIMLVALGIWWWFGAYLMFQLIHVPYTAQFKTIGMYIIIGSFVWQIAVIAQKMHEIKLLSIRMLIIICAVTVFQLCYYTFNTSPTNPVIYAKGYAIAAMLYLILIFIDGSYTTSSMVVDLKGGEHV